MWQLELLLSLLHQNSREKFMTSDFDPERSLSLRQIELPRNTKAICQPTKSRAKAIVAQWHHDVSAICKPIKCSIQVYGLIKIDEQGHRGREIKFVRYWTVDHYQGVPTKIDLGYFYEARCGIARSIFFNGHDFKARKD
jgi:hypothetical protein